MSEVREPVTGDKPWSPKYTYVPALRVGNMVWLSGTTGTDDSGKIVEFREKPKGEALETMKVDTTRFGLAADQAASRPFLASMGIYVFDYERLLELLQEDMSWVDFGREIIPAAIDKYNVQAHLFAEYWEDIGTIRAFYDANLDLASPLPKFNFFNTAAPIYTRSRHLPPSKLHDCDIDNSMVSEGCILNGLYARNSIIGLRSRIDAGTMTRLQSIWLWCAAMSPTSRRVSAVMPT